MKKYPGIKSLKELQEEYWNDFRDKFLEDFIEDFASDYENQEQKAPKDIMTRANTAFANFTFKKRNEFIEECESKGEIWSQIKYPYNKNWVVNDAKIKKTLKRYPKLLNIICFIDKESRFVKSVDGKSLIVKKKDWNPKRQISYFTVDKKFYERATSELDLAQITIQKTIQEFCKIGILRKIENHKLAGRAAVYSDGYFYSGFTGKDKKHWMKQSDHSKALREFSYSNK